MRRVHRTSKLPELGGWPGQPHGPSQGDLPAESDDPAGAPLQGVAPDTDVNPRWGLKRVPSTGSFRSGGGGTVMGGRSFRCAGRAPAVPRSGCAVPTSEQRRGRIAPACSWAAGRRGLRESRLPSWQQSSQPAVARLCGLEAPLGSAWFQVVFCCWLAKASSLPASSREARQGDQGSSVWRRGRGTSLWSHRRIMPLLVRLMFYATSRQQHCATLRRAKRSNPPQ